jgi:DNA-binding MarR family transcriptional regulator
MNSRAPVREDAIDRLWETLPPLWSMIRSRIRSEATGHFGLTLEQFQILRLVRRGRCSISEVAESRNISRPAVSQGVEMLVKKGLLTRVDRAEDRRYVELALTPSGNILLDEVFGKTSSWMKERMSTLSADEMQTVADAMQSLKKMLA